jgi:hypothetical protein
VDHTLGNFNSVLSLTLTASCDEESWILRTYVIVLKFHGQEAKNRIFRQIQLQTHILPFTTFCQDKSWMQSYVLGTFVKKRTRFSLLLLQEIPVSLKPLLLHTGREGQCLLNSLLLACAHFSSYTFACENYLPQLPN